MNIISSIVVSSLMTCAIGLKATASGVFIFAYVIFCFMITGESLGVIFCSAFYHVGFSLNLVNTLISVFSKYSPLPPYFLRTLI
jgi:hypothetical protein